jgi:E3 ubiquitin-protein ligase SHPRH
MLCGIARFMLFDLPCRLRHVKRFLAPPSPLPCVQWWRLCLDEAQMVECTGSKTAEMARRLGAVHRWAITGTPIQKSMQGEFILVVHYFSL